MFSPPSWSQYRRGNNNILHFLTHNVNKVSNICSHKANDTGGNLCHLFLFNVTRINKRIKVSNNLTLIVYVAGIRMSIQHHSCSGTGQPVSFHPVSVKMPHIGRMPVIMYSIGISLYAPDQFIIFFDIRKSYRKPPSVLWRGGKILWRGYKETPKRERKLLV